jgi:hypothetical protein
MTEAQGAELLTLVANLYVAVRYCLVMVSLLTGLVGLLCYQAGRKASK